MLEKGELREAKSLTPTIYKQVGDLFRSVFSQYASRAHSLLFVAELPSFRATLPEDLVEEMDKVCTRATTNKCLCDVRKTPFYSLFFFPFLFDC